MSLIKKNDLVRPGFFSLFRARSKSKCQSWCQSMILSCFSRPFRRWVLDSGWSMARKVRVHVSGALYQVMNRGDCREDILVCAAPARTRWLPRAKLSPPPSGPLSSALCRQLCRNFVAGLTPGHNPTTVG